MLKIFEENRGVELSGETLGKTLGVSRTAVWKTVGKLRSEGHEILSCTKGGYTLSEQSDIISAVGIQMYLRSSHEITVFDEIDSTNSRAKLMAIDGAADGSVVVAECQSGGRGRRGRSFFSPRGAGVYFSIIIRPNISYLQCQKVVPLSAVAVTQAIHDVCGLDTQIKWVNDVYFNGKKVVGIGTESIGQLGEDKPEALIVGIGINVTTDNFPEELHDKAGSLGVKVNRNRLIAECINCFDRLYPGVSESLFIPEYRQKCFVLGKKVNVLCEKPYEALALDVDENGALIVETEGKLVTLNTEEVSVRII